MFKRYAYGWIIARIDHEFERHSGHTPHAHATEVAKNAGRELRGPNAPPARL